MSMTDTTHAKKGVARVLRALKRDGDILVVAHDPSPNLEAALRDVLTALLLKVKFKTTGRPFTFDQLAFFDAVHRHWIDEGMTKEDALLLAGQECSAPLGRAKSREAKLARLEKHYAKAEPIKNGERLLEWIVEADTNRKAAEQIESGQAALARGWAELANAQRKLNDDTRKLADRERAFRIEKDATFTRKNQL